MSSFAAANICLLSSVSASADCPLIFAELNLPPLVRSITRSLAATPLSVKMKSVSSTPPVSRVNALPAARITWSSLIGLVTTPLLIMPLTIALTSCCWWRCRS